MNNIIIAIDGFSSCGKSTMAKTLARRTGYKYIDTGAMYRAVTLYALQHKLFNVSELDVAKLEKAMKDIHISFAINPVSGLTETILNGQNVEREIRGMEVAGRVSSIAALPFVRDALVKQQRLLGADKGIVMDGRDIGTVVFPEAELKIFVTASAEIRALRRLQELQTKGENVSFEDILQNIKSRDYQDTTRATAPLRRADDAIELDNTNMTPEQQDEWLYEKYREKCLT